MTLQRGPGLSLGTGLQTVTSTTSVRDTFPAGKVLLILLLSTDCSTQYLASAVWGLGSHSVYFLPSTHVNMLELYESPLSSLNILPLTLASPAAPRCASRRSAACSGLQLTPLAACWEPGRVYLHCRFPFSCMSERTVSCSRVCWYAVFRLLLDFTAAPICFSRTQSRSSGRGTC